jgi:hypothetical protein
MGIPVYAVTEDQPEGMVAYLCSYCEGLLIPGDKYCPSCDNKIDWNVIIPAELG